MRVGKICVQSVCGRCFSNRLPHEGEQGVYTSRATGMWSTVEVLETVWLLQSSPYKLRKYWYNLKFLHSVSMMDSGLNNCEEGR